MGHSLARNPDRINDWKLDGEGASVARGGCQSAYPKYGLELSRGVKDGQKGLKERDITCTYRDIVYIHRHIHRHIHTYRHIQTHTHIYRYICMYVIFKCAKIRVPEKWMINTAKSRSKASFGYLCYQILHSTEDDDQEINQK